MGPTLRTLVYGEEQPCLRYNEHEDMCHSIVVQGFSFILLIHVIKAVVNTYITDRKGRYEYVICLQVYKSLKKQNKQKQKHKIGRNTGRARVGDRISCLLFTGFDVQTEEFRNKSSYYIPHLSHVAALQVSARFMGADARL